MGFSVSIWLWQELLRCEAEDIYHAEGNELETVCAEASCADQNMLTLGYVCQ